jgi:hypothetical protein
MNLKSNAKAYGLNFFAIAVCYTLNQSIRKNSIIQIKHYQYIVLIKLSYALFKTLIRFLKRRVKKAKYLTFFERYIVYGVLPIKIKMLPLAAFLFYLIFQYTDFIK